MDLGACGDAAAARRSDCRHEGAAHALGIQHMCTTQCCKVAALVAAHALGIQHICTAEGGTTQCRKEHICTAEGGTTQCRKEHICTAVGCWCLTTQCRKVARLVRNSRGCCDGCWCRTTGGAGGGGGGGGGGIKCVRVCVWGAVARSAARCGERVGEEEPLYSLGYICIVTVGGARERVSLLLQRDSDGSIPKTATFQGSG